MYMEKIANELVMDSKGNMDVHQWGGPMPRTVVQDEAQFRIDLSERPSKFQMYRGALDTSSDMI